MSETDVTIDLFLDWLNRSRERRFQWDESSGTAVDGSVRLAVEAYPLIAAQNSAWLAARTRLEEQVGAAVPAALAIWVPAGAELPSGEPATSAFINCVRDAAGGLGVHERSQISLPVKLYLRKTANRGGVVSVVGGLSPCWARFTEHVRGTYDLDSTRLHRLPASEEHLDGLIDTIIERAAPMEAGSWTEIETIDAWTIQRLPAEDGITIVGIPPADWADAGIEVRRNFRRILTEAVPRLRGGTADLRALVVLGHYARMEQEGATTAMRGYDPALYSGLDFVCLVADGLVKPLIQAADGPQRGNPG